MLRIRVSPARDRAKEPAHIARNPAICARIRADNRERCFARGLALSSLSRVNDPKRLALDKLRRASALIELGRFDQALSTCDEALALDPFSSEAHVTRSRVLIALRRYRDSERSAREALTHAPRDWFAHFLVARSAMLAGEPARAIPLFLAVLELAPSDAITRVYLGVCQHDVAEREQALQSVERALELGPDDPTVLTNAARVLTEHGDALRGEKLVLRALHHSPNDGKYLRLLSWVRGRAGKDLQSEMVAREAVRAEPNSAQGWWTLGLAEWRLQRLPSATQALIEAMRLRPKDLDIVFDLAQVLWRQGRSVEAIDVADHGLAVDEADPRLRALRAAISSNPRKFA